MNLHTRLSVYLDTPVIFEAEDLPKSFTTNLLLASIDPDIITEGIWDTLVSNWEKAGTESEFLKSMQNKIGKVKKDVGTKLLNIMRNWSKKNPESNTPEPTPETKDLAKSGKMTRRERLTAHIQNYPTKNSTDSAESDAKPAWSGVRGTTEEERETYMQTSKVRSDAINLLKQMAEKYPRKQVTKIVDTINDRWSKNPRKYVKWIRDIIIPSLNKESAISKAFSSAFKKIISDASKLKELRAPTIGDTSDSPEPKFPEFRSRSGTYSPDLDVQKSLRF